MEEFEKTREEIRNNIYKNIEYLSKKLTNTNPNTNIYKEILDKIDIEKRSLDIINNLSYDKYISNKTKQSETIKKYGFLIDNNEDYKNKIKYALILIQKTKQFQKEELFTKSKEITKFSLEEAINDKKEYDDNSQEMKKIFNNNLINYLNKLKENISSNYLPNIKNISYFESFDNKELIKRIKELTIKINKQEQQGFKNNKNIDKVSDIFYKLKEYEKKILDNVEMYLAFIFVIFKNRLHLTTSFTGDIKLLINNLEEEFEEKEKNYSQFINQIESKLKNQSTLDLLTTKSKETIKMLIKDISSKYDFNINDLIDLSNIKMNDFLAEMKIYDILLNKKNIIVKK